MIQDFTKSRNIMLNNANEIPNIGFGTWKIKDGEQVCESVKCALTCGYRHIDTAAAYGNEFGVGEGIKNSGVKRDEIFLTSKLWNSERAYDKAIAACDESLMKLKTDYLDLYLMHWPASPAVHDDWREINADAWRALETLVRDGKVKSIGVCNFKSTHLEELLKTAQIKPAIDQIEFHPGMLQEETREFCVKNNILVEAWSPLGSGKMIKKAEISEIAEKYGVTAAQFCIRWCLQNNALPLPKSKTAERIAENLDVFNFTISQEDMEKVNAFPYMGGSGLDPDTITVLG